MKLVVSTDCTGISLFFLFFFLGLRMLASASPSSIALSTFGSFKFLSFERVE
ncbi:hypothetical protein Sjap_003636 [Stephania japonica]|uniref:Uncharacterized protein n=1 Tax=Stephania japonica TaxID=461633 RepID=A0AAP0KP65_9MAGN